MSFAFTGAKNSREVVFSVLRDAYIDGDLSIPEAVEAAKDILARNAIHFYKISLANSAVSSHSNLPQKLNDGLDIDVSLVRIMWVDGSGQHRCRVSFPQALFCHFIVDIFCRLKAVICEPCEEIRKMFTLKVQMVEHLFSLFTFRIKLNCVVFSPIMQCIVNCISFS